MTTIDHGYKNFDKLPGKIENEIYCFPKLFSIDTRERIRQWQIFVMLVPVNDKTYEHNWDIDLEEYYEIKPEYFNSHKKLSTKIMALVYNEQGIVGMKLSRNAPTRIIEGAQGLQGKANERNTFTQALIRAAGEYNSKISNGYTTDKKVTKTKADLYYAMAAKKYEDEKSKIVFPCYSQPKLDGVRCLMTMHDSKVIKYSRDHNPWPNFDEFDKLLKPIFEQYLGIVIDGELYKHGKRLQEIVGVARNEKKSMELNYCIFDVFLPEEPQLTFEQRYEILQEVSTLVENPRVIFVETTIANNFKDLDNLYQKYVKHNYEGQMIRMRDAPYAISKLREIRSGAILKRKKKFTEEYEFVRAIAAENGRAKNTFIGIFKTKDGREFRATPKGMSIPEMREFLTLVNKEIAKYSGKMATIEFEDISKDGIPLRPKFVTFREGND
jgi:ATP-dependent DNA ligase